MKTTQVATELDVYSVTECGGHKVILTLPNMAGDAGSNEEGAAVFGASYIVDLVRCAIAHGVTDPGAIRAGVRQGEADAARYAREGVPNRSITMEEFERLCVETDQHVALALHDVSNLRAS